VCHETNGLWQSVFLSLYGSIKTRGDEEQTRWRTVVLSREMQLSGVRWNGRTRLKRSLGESGAGVGEDAGEESNRRVLRLGMGLRFVAGLTSKLSNALLHEKYKALVVGLPGCGKTAILKKLSFRKPTQPPSLVVSSDLTLGMLIPPRVNASAECLEQALLPVGRVETVEQDDLMLSALRLDVDQKMRLIYMQLFPFVDAIVVVVDSSDRATIKDTALSLESLLSEEWLAVRILLILANKSDLPSSMTKHEVAQQLNLFTVAARMKNCRCQPCSAITGEGVLEGIEWLREQLKMYQHVEPGDEILKRHHFPLFGGQPTADLWA